ncbi:MAG: TonB-dependent receptor, partial [Burkholderiaceae bacterium]|nr:TonB-dependent receptor [Burkholderiaceae bacterium]
MFRKNRISLAVLSLSACSTAVLAQEAAPQPEVKQLEVVIVTSQKRVEDVKQVPLSVSAISAEGLKEGQMSNFDDLARNIPNLSNSNAGGPGLSTIEMRGVSSAAGSATVGVYLDDISLTTRNLYSQGTAEPRFFDLERVEVLRGPQGTLYGASSMGGTMKFISKQPDLKHFGGDVQLDVSSTDHTSQLNGQVQVVLNAPIQTDQLALRIGVQAGHLAGYINQVSDQTLQTIAKGIDSNDWTVLKAALKLKVNNDWTVTPGLFYQKMLTGDVDASYTSVGSYQQYNAGVALPIFTTSKIEREPGSDTLTVPSLTVNGDVGFADFTGVLNGYKRSFKRTQDGTDVNSPYVGSQILNTTVSNIVTYLPSAVYLDNEVSQTSLELRMASKAADYNANPISWVGGAYFSQNKTDVADTEPIFGINAAFTNNGLNINDLAQWAAGSGMFVGGFANDLSYYSARHYDDMQSSVFGELTYHFSDSLRGIVGLRYLQASEEFHREGNYFFAGGPLTFALNTTAHKATPRFALDWDVSKTTTVYANIAEGFRLGGVNRPIPLTISGNVSDLANLGLTSAPMTFAPDSLWSYEVGSKSRLLDNRVELNLAAFYINWSNIQQDVYLPTAGFDFETNVGNAISKGVEFSLKARLTNSLLLNVSGNYTSAYFAEDVPWLGTISSGNPGLNVQKGDPIEGVPKFGATVGGEYQFGLTDNIDSALRLNAQWVGSSHGTFVRSNPDYLRPGYMTIDGSWSLYMGKYNLNFMVKNL